MFQVSSVPAACRATKELPENSALLVHKESKESVDRRDSKASPDPLDLMGKQVKSDQLGLLDHLDLLDHLGHLGRRGLLGRQVYLDSLEHQSPLDRWV